MPLYASFQLALWCKGIVKIKKFTGYDLNRFMRALTTPSCAKKIPWKSRNKQLLFKTELFECGLGKADVSLLFPRWKRSVFLLNLAW